jgi:hypothetical protein
MEGREGGFSRQARAPRVKQCVAVLLRDIAQRFSAVLHVAETFSPAAFEASDGP